MKPSVQQIITAAQRSLREKVMPVVEDQWAASTLRSVDLILSHLHARTVNEGPLLYEDNKELVALMSGVTEIPGDHPELQDELNAFLKRADTVFKLEYPAVDTLALLNIEGRTLVDNLLNLCIRKNEEIKFGTLHEKLKQYLMHHIDRERDFYFPTFVGRPV